MSDLLDSRLTEEQRLECARNDAAMGIRCDERELDVFPELAELSALETARIRADLERNVNKGPRLAARGDAQALADQVINLDAMRRAGW